MTPEHPHWSLILMTVLTQLSVGAFVTIWLLQLLGASTHLGIAALTSLAVGSLALGAATLHLGRPAFAYRALKMWRRSWLSREVLLFSAFSGVAGAYAGSPVVRRPGKSADRRHHGAARHCRCHRQCLHLPGAVAAVVEHVVHARAVQSDRRRARAAVCRGGRRRRSTAAGADRRGDGRRAGGAAGATVLPLHRLGQSRTARHGPAAVDGARQEVRAARRACSAPAPSWCRSLPHRMPACWCSPPP